MREAARLCPASRSSPTLHRGADSVDKQGVLSRTLAILTSSLWLSGCFVLEEFERGDALIEQHSVGWRKKKAQMAAEAEATATEEEKSDSSSWKFWEDKKDQTLREHLGEWWRKAVEEKPATADSADEIVRCSIGEKVLFTRQSDCDLRRGHSEARPDKRPPAKS